MDVVRVLSCPQSRPPMRLFLMSLSVLTGSAWAPLHSCSLSLGPPVTFCWLVVGSLPLDSPTPFPGVGAEAKLLSSHLRPCEAPGAERRPGSVLAVPRNGWVLHGLQVGAAVVLCPSRCPGFPPTWGPRPLTAAEEAQGQAWAGPGDT